MKNIIIEGTQKFSGKEIPVVSGGFGQDKKCMSDKTIAEIHGMEVKNIRARITDNIKRFKENIDIIDLKKGAYETSTLDLLIVLGYSKQSITQAEHIYILSERGYAKLIKIMDSELAWEIHDKLIDEYFILREDNIKLPISYKEALQQLLITVEEKEALETTVKVKEQQILELKPKATYYDLVLHCKGLLSMTTISKDYGKSAQWMNEKLHELGIQYCQGGVWFLYQKYAMYGYTQTQTHVHSCSGGELQSKVHMYWTQVGRLFIYEQLKKNGIAPLIEKPTQLSFSGI